MRTVPLGWGGPTRPRRTPAGEAPRADPGEAPRAPLHGRPPSPGRAHEGPRGPTGSAGGGGGEAPRAATSSMLFFFFFFLLIHTKVVKSKKTTKSRTLLVGGGGASGGRPHRHPLPRRGGPTGDDIGLVHVMCRALLCVVVLLRCAVALCVALCACVRAVCKKTPQRQRLCSASCKVLVGGGKRAVSMGWWC